VRHAALAIAPAVVLLASMPAGASHPIKPGQWTIGHIQDICLKDDGTWYGTTFNMSGRWVVDPVVRIHAAIYGNYQIQGHDYTGYGNTSISIQKLGEDFEAYWYDWFDDLSYGYFNDFPFIREKSNCDPPFTGENTMAPSQ
jgi:hypothetical protein